MFTTSSKNAFIDYNNKSEMNVANDKEKLFVELLSNIQ